MPQIKITTPNTKRLRLMKLLGICVSLLLLIHSGHEHALIAVDSPAITQLSPNTSARREVSPRTADVVEITMDKDKLLHLLINKGDLVLTTVVYGPTGAKLLEHISHELEIVEIALPAEVAGNYKIEIRSREKVNEPRSYELKVQPFVVVTTREQKDSEARQLLAEAELLRSNWTASDLRQAKVKFDQAAQIWESFEDFSNAARATLKAGNICFRLSEFGEAQKRYEKAEVFTKWVGDELLQSKALSRSGVVYSYLGDNEQGQNYVARALDLLKSAANASDPLVRNAYGEALANTAEVNYSKGELAKALEQFLEARKSLDQNRETLAKVHRFMGYIAGSLGNPHMVEAEITRALELSRATNDKTGEGLGLTLHGVFYAFTGRPHVGMELHKAALDIFKSIGDRHSEAIALRGIGQTHHVLRDYQNAIINTETALRLDESIGVLDSVAVDTFKLAQLYQQSGKHEQALNYLDRSLALSRSTKKVRNEANALSEIAVVYASQKRPKEAKKLQQKAQQFYERIGDRRGQATALNRYGNFLLMTGEEEQALDVYNQSLALGEKVRDTALIIDTLYHIASANTALGNNDVGLTIIERSIKIIEDLRDEVGSPDLRALFFSNVRKHYDSYRDILMQLDNAQPNQGFAVRAFLMSEKSRVRSLVDRVRESQARLRQGAAAELLARERELGSLIQALAQYELELSFNPEKERPKREDVSRRLAQLRAEYQQNEVKLRTQHPKLMRLESFEITDLKQVQQELQASNSMLLQYALGAQQSYLWAITSDSFHSHKLPADHQIDAAVKELSDLMVARQKFDRHAISDYQANIETADKLYGEKARALSQMLLGPVADQLGNKRLILVTEGQLQRLSFESLPLPRSQATGPIGLEEFLIRSNEIVTLPSMTTLLAMRAEERSPSPGKLVAIIADPVLNLNDERVSGQEQSPGAVRAMSVLSLDLPVLRNRPSRLIYAAEEADAIVAVAPRGSTMLATGFDASRETAMSSAIRGFQIVHFATHGFLDSDHPELSGILLTSVDQNGVERNGLMALHDIYTLDLSAELTVLSACETALGKDIPGEGLVGLTHSVMSAGSKSVVASLWKVDDQATATLMSDFYHSMLREGMPPVAALRAAKLKMMQDKRWQAPYYWAGFVFQGDYDSRIKVENNSYLVLVLAFLLLALCSVVLVLFLRRRHRLSPAVNRLNQGK